MSRKSLINATKTYLACEKRLAESVDVLDRPLLRSELDHARQTLRDELHAAAKAMNGSGGIRNIMVAVDEAEPSAWAVERAVRLAEDLGAKVTVIHVVDLTPVAMPELAFYEGQARRALEEAARGVLHKKAAMVPKHLLAEELLREGNVAKQVVEAAEQFKTDLLVVGTHGRGAVARLLLGSTAEAVLRHAHCPVLAVGRPPDAACQTPREMVTAAAQ